MSVQDGISYKERITRLGFTDKQKGQLIAALIKMPRADRAEVFDDDSDEVVKATLEALLSGFFFSLFLYTCHLFITYRLNISYFILYFCVLQLLQPTQYLLICVCSLYLSSTVL